MRMRMSNPQNNLDLDRFIPNRSGIDFDYARSMLTSLSAGNKDNANPTATRYGACRRHLAEAMNQNRNRILAFRNKPPAPVDLFPPNFFYLPLQVKTPGKLKGSRRHIPQSPNRTLDAPYLADDHRIDVLDWGSSISSVLAIALSNILYFFNAPDGGILDQVALEDEMGPAPIYSVSLGPDGRRIAIGMQCSLVHLLDSSSNQRVRTLGDCHELGLGVGSLAWTKNDNIVTTGGMDGCIVVNDLRIRSHIVQTYRGHGQEICGIKWSATGHQLASGGNDNLLCIWDSRRSDQSLHRFEDHAASVRALAWCPFQENLLSSGGGDGDGCIKFWNTDTGACFKSINTGSQVCALQWNKNDRELLSSHGFPHNQLTLWEYPSMAKLAELYAHSRRVLYMAQSPNGCTVASAAGGDDETLRFWNVFEVKPAPKANPEPFAHVNRIR